jgi:molecular chaperone GrpE
MARADGIDVGTTNAAPEATEDRGREERLLRDWLEVVDSVDRALLIEQGSPVEKGLQAVLSQMEDVLARHGVERIEPYGQPFDPSLHEAIGTQAGEDVAGHTVLAVARAGYRIGDRLLRPAEVVVSRPAGEAV